MKTSRSEENEETNKKVIVDAVEKIEEDLKDEISVRNHAQTRFDRAQASFDRAQASFDRAQS